MVGGMRKQMMRKVIAIVMRMKQHRSDPPIGYVARVREDSAGIQSKVVCHFAESRNGMENGGSCDRPQKNEQKCKVQTGYGGEHGLICRPPKEDG